MKRWTEIADRHIAAGEIPPVPQPSHPPVDNKHPSALYNAMIHPLAGFAMRRAIWYQGESNVADGAAYTDKMQALIEGWRSVWGIGDFPFYFVQLAPFRSYSGEQLGQMWEAQLHAQQTIPNTGMVVTTDIGNLKIFTREISMMLDGGSLWALAHQYNVDVPFSGFESMPGTKSAITPCTFASRRGWTLIYRGTAQRRLRARRWRRHLCRGDHDY